MSSSDLYVPVDIDSSANISYGSISQLGDVPQVQQQNQNQLSIQYLWNKGYLPASQLSTTKNEQVREFYRSQNTLLEEMARASDYKSKPINELTGSSEDQPEPERTQSESSDIRMFLKNDVHELERQKQAKEKLIQNAFLASNICNAFLLCAQMYAFISTSSFSILAVFIDAFLDVVSGLIVTFTSHLRKQKDNVKYPVGRERLEPLGVIIMACIMTAATLITLEQSIGTLIENEPRILTITFRTNTILIIALITKSLLFLYCRNVDDGLVQALAKDHFNDCLSNLTSFITMFLTNYIVWWIDPVGAIVMSILIIRNWATHTVGHCEQLLGIIASPHILNLITFLACNHSPHILLVDTVRAYHVGSGIYTEVHVVLDADMPLAMAHDIGESLQNRIESLDQVERCFVHLDVEALHSPKTEHKDI